MDTIQSSFRNVTKVKPGDRAVIRVDSSYFLATVETPSKKGGIEVRFDDGVLYTAQYKEYIGSGISEFRKAPFSKECVPLFLNNVPDVKETFLDDWRTMSLVDKNSLDYRYISNLNFPIEHSSLHHDEIYRKVIVADEHLPLIRFKGVLTKKCTLWDTLDETLNQNNKVDTGHSALLLKLSKDYAVSRILLNMFSFKERQDCNHFHGYLVHSVKVPPFNIRIEKDHKFRSILSAP